MRGCVKLKNIVGEKKNHNSVCVNVSSCVVFTDFSEAFCFISSVNLAISQHKSNGLMCQHLYTT